MTKKFIKAEYANFKPKFFPISPFNFCICNLLSYMLAVISSKGNLQVES
jgi:hypothetical protein